MLKRSFIGVCSLLCAAIGFGQRLDELRHNPHIGWIAEVEHDWILDIPADTNYVLNDHNAARLQQWIQTPTLVEVLPNEFARSTILYAIQSGDLPIYQDPACTHALHYPDLVSQDTVYSCEEGIPFIIINPHEPADIYFFRVHQLIYYNTQTGRFGTTSISVAPILKKRDVEGDFISFEPLCWFKADHKGIHNISSKPNITLAIQTWSRSSANFLNMDTSAILKKQPQALEPCKHLFQLLISDISEKKKGKFYTNNWNRLEPISLEQGRNIIAWKDTLVVFEPSTDEEQTIVKSNNLLEEEIKELRLIQNWYWNDKKKKLSIHLKAVAPMRDIFGDDGFFRYKKPLFFRFTQSLK